MKEPSQGYMRFMEDWVNDNKAERLHREFGINPNIVLDKYHLSTDEKSVLLSIYKECSGKENIELVNRVNSLMTFKKPW